jgi:hypothetical protein
MANTFELISSVTLASPAATIGFTSIPATFTDLCLVFSFRTTNSSSARAEDSLVLALNGDTTGANYTMRYLRGNGSTAGSVAPTGYSGTYVGEMNGSTSTASTFTSGSVYLPNYTVAVNKSFSIDIVQEANATAAYMHLDANLWSNTATVNQMTFSNYNSNTFATYSTAYLYGVSNA